MNGEEAAGEEEMGLGGIRRPAVRTEAGRGRRRPAVRRAWWGGGWGARSGRGGGGRADPGREAPDLAGGGPVAAFEPPR